ncbi:MAG: PocR ligand-binding domain-containing protein, partial [Clostridia bacterium]|nr:PocR ligand-binding domain-containing protein [Clostridia bacterium]
MIFSSHTNQLLKSFYTITGIKIVVMDAQLNEIYSQPAGHSPYCSEIGRRCPGKCKESTREFCQKSKRIDGLYSGRCFAGLFEAVFPLKKDHLTVGYLMCGQILIREDRVEEGLFLGEGYEVVQKTREEIAASIDVLQAFAQSIMYKDIVNLNKDEPGIRIAQYISHNLSRDLSIPTLARRFALCKSELYRVTAPYMPGGITKYIKKVRMDRAKELLAHTDLSMKSIA